MVRPYTLLRAVVGFSTADKRIVAIPAGALITLVILESGVGITSTLFEGRTILVASEDVAQNAIAAE